MSRTCLKIPREARFATVRGWLRRIGITLLAASVLGFLTLSIGTLDSASLAIGQQSGYRTLGEIAVIGCLLAAIGYWND